MHPRLSIIVTKRKEEFNIETREEEMEAFKLKKASERESFENGRYVNNCKENIYISFTG